MKSDFRPIHYLGSKLRLLNFIQETIDSINPSKGIVCDLFSGSGVVSKHLSLTRPVISNDIQEYSRILSSALLLPYKKVNFENIDVINSEIYKKIYFLFEPLILYEEKSLNKLKENKVESIAELISYGSLKNFRFKKKEIFNTIFRTALDETNKRIDNSDLNNSNKIMITRYYGGVYFSFSQAIILDALLEIKESLPEQSKNIFHAAILSTASDIVNTVGKQFAQPLNLLNRNGENKVNLSKKILSDRKLDVLVIFKDWLNKYNNQEKSPFNNSVFRLDYEDVLNDDLNISVVYADPPYTRYHYSRYYHVLESISLRDNPQVTTIKLSGKETISKGIYREDRHQSPFGLKSESDHAFDTLFRKTANIKASLILSYSPYDDNSKATPRVQTIENLQNMAKKYFKSVELVSFGQFSHSKLNKADLHVDASDTAELLLVCKN